MKVVIKKRTKKKILNINNQINLLKKEMEDIIEVYGDAIGMEGSWKLDMNTWELEDSSKSDDENEVHKVL